MVSLCGFMEDPDMGADTTKPSVNLAREADDDLRAKYAAEKRAVVASELALVAQHDGTAEAAEPKADDPAASH